MGTHHGIDGYLYPRYDDTLKVNPVASLHRLHRVITNKDGTSEAVLGGFGWHYTEIMEQFGPVPIEQYHKVSEPDQILPFPSWPCRPIPNHNRSSFP